MPDFDSDQSSSVNSDSNVHLDRVRACCSEGHFLCCLLPLCVETIRFIYRELKRPTRNQRLAENDLVLLDMNLDFESPNLYGIVVKTTLKTVQIYTNGGNYEKRLKRNVQKVRFTEVSDRWFEDLHSRYIHSIYAIE